MHRTLTLTLVSLVALGLASVAGADHHHQHGDDIIVGRSLAGQLMFEGHHLDEPKLLNPVAALLKGWTGVDPGFDALHADEPHEGFYTLQSGVQAHLEVVAIDNGLKAWQSGLGAVAQSAGDRILLGGDHLHTHPIWHLDSDVLGTDWIGTLTGTFRLVDTGSTGYTPSEPFTLHFTNVPEPTTLALMGLGLLGLRRRRR